nr:immunoglobulin heavy chain junction region [Mus musculus]MBK4195516.1 immunoglobulin heavy chain junction region [Mus musculus]MBK4195517.1 immunoglobulin heavy chain junction region [Mus musculus]
CVRDSYYGYGGFDYW